MRGRITQPVLSPEWDMKPVKPEQRVSRMSRRTDPESSKAAARKHGASFCHGSHKQMLYDAIRRQPGLTAGQYNDLLEWRYATAGKRVNELRDLGLIYSQDNGTKPMTWFPVGLQ